LYRTGLGIAVTNPKAILFFAALFPQFIVETAPLLPQFLTLTAIFMALSFISLMSYGALGGKAKALLANAKVWSIYKRVVGLVYIGFGLGLLIFTGKPKASA
jgi:threonine/homoserine/homoserine lactone efflux protein